MWYNCFKEYLLKEGYGNTLYVHVFSLKRKEKKTTFVIIIVYIDVLNLVITYKELTRIVIYLKK